MALPTILEGGAAGDSGQRATDSQGTYFEVELWTTAGLDYGYSQTRTAVYRSQVTEARWQYDRTGGADSGVFVVEGGVADLDTAIQGQYELRALRQGVIWYKGRLVAYEHFTTPDGFVKTRMRTEGYQTKLAEIRVNRTIAAGQTVAQAITTIYNGDIQPNSRIRLVASAISGSYVLAGTLVFDCSAFEALRTLAILQGTTEWGVAESAQIFFHQQVSTTSETANVALGQRVPEMSESGSFQRAYNRIVAYGASFGTATSNNAAAQAVYGVREVKVHFPWVSNAATDLQRIADNICASEKDGASRLYGVVEGPSQRLERSDRVDPTNSATPQGKFTFWGIDGSKTSEHYQKVRYRYRTASPTRFYAEVWAGAAEETLVREIYRLRTRIDALFQAASGGAAAGSISAGTTKATLGEAVLSNSNGISFGADGQTITASYAAKISAGTQSALLSALTFSDSNGVSFGLSASTMTASHDGLKTAIQSVSAGTTKITSGEVVFGDSNGVSFGADGQTITASVSTGFSGFKANVWPAVGSDHATFNSSHRTLRVQMIAIPFAMSVTRVDLLQSWSISSGGQTRSVTMTASYGLYTTSGSTASLATSGSGVIVSTSGDISASDLDGIRFRSATLNNSFSVTPGNYLLAIHYSTSASNLSMTASQLGVGVRGGQIVISGSYSGAGNIVDNWAHPGYYSVEVTSAMPASVHISDIVRTTLAHHQNAFTFMGS